MARTANRLMRLAVLKFSIRSRTRKATLITEFMAQRGAKTLILSGVGGVFGVAGNETIVEDALTAAGTVVAAYDVRPVPHPGWNSVVGDGRALPFRADAADLIVANAVIEHVGGEVQQRQFVAEHVRVGRDWVITTPNRWFPVESHTSAVLRHWSPKWRDSRDEFTRLLSLREFKAMLPVDARVVGRPWSATFTAMSR